MLEHIALDNQRYCGKPMDVGLTIALGHTGAVQIELMLQHHSAPSVYEQFLEAGRVGPHHFGLMPPDY